MPSDGHLSLICPNVSQEGSSTGLKSASQLGLPTGTGLEGIIPLLFLISRFCLGKEERKLVKSRFICPQYHTYYASTDIPSVAICLEIGETVGTCKLLVVIAR